MLTRRFLGLSVAATAGLAAMPTPAQETLTAEERFRVEGRYLPQYLELKGKAAVGDESALALLPQFAAFLGDERTAIGSQERERPLDLTLPDLADAESRDALDVIVEAATDRQIVILNEAHNISGHRGFAARVMRALRPLGFDTLAAETFNPRTPAFRSGVWAYREGAPFRQALGYYTADPVFAEMVREAASLGYGFADYEQRDDQSAAEDASGEERVVARETAQAANLIENVLKSRPDARLFILCGYNHVLEAEGWGGLWFAGRLKAATGIDPLTIDQSGNWPGTRPETDSPQVAAVLRRFAPTAPIVVWRDGTIFANRIYDGKTDLSVFHPRLPRVAGRPGWLAADPVRRPVEVATPPFDGPTLLQALHIDEGPGIPADHLLLEPGQERATLMLRPGRYFVRLETTRGIEPAFGSVTVRA